MCYCCFFVCFCQFGMNAQNCFTHGCMLSFVFVAGRHCFITPSSLILVTAPSKPIKKVNGSPSLPTVRVGIKHLLSGFLITKKKNKNKVSSTTTTMKKSKQTPNTLSDIQLKKYGQSCRKPYNPCKNNAICKQVKVQDAPFASTSSSSSNNFSSKKIKIKIHCFCPNGFKGRFCDEDIDECNGEVEQLLVNQQLNSKIKLITHDVGAAPCVPNAQCENTLGSYVCNCNHTDNCYNTHSPKFQHLSSESSNYKYSNYHFTQDENEKENDEIEIVNYDDDDDNQIDEKDVTQKTQHLSNSVIRQALFGLFGGISAILIVLSLGAGIACKINMNQNRTNANVVNNNTNNNNNNNDLFSESSSSASNSKKLSSNNTRFTRLNKQRSSQTASLLSSTSGDELHFKKR